MAKDYAKKSSGKRKNTKRSSTQRSAAKSSANGLRIYIAGVLSGLFLALLFYLAIQPAEESPATADRGKTEKPATAKPKPKFDFYTKLPEENLEIEVEQSPSRAAPTQSGDRVDLEAGDYFLQAGSFRLKEDADRRRAQLLLLGLEPTIRGSTGDNGRWFRVFLGPFESRAAMSRARALTAKEDIETLLLRSP